jgi:hypothetical protein
MPELRGAYVHRKDVKAVSIRQPLRGQQQQFSTNSVNRKLPLSTGSADEQMMFDEQQGQIEASGAHGSKTP